MPLTTIFNGGTRIIGDSTAIEETLHPTVMNYINVMRQSSGGNYSMSLNEIDAVNNMVKAMVANGIWSKMKAVYPVIGGTAAAHKYNLVDSRDADAAFRLSFVGGWTHDSNGMTPNGTTGYANTFLNATTVQTTNHLAFYSRTSSVAGTQQEMGAWNGSLFSQLRVAANYLAGSTTATFTTTSDARGFWVGSKTSNTNRSVFLNGSRQAINTASDATNNPNLNIWIGARNFNNSAALFSNKQCALASIGDGLTDVEVRAFYQIVQTYQTKLGRQV